MSYWNLESEERLIGGPSRDLQSCSTVKTPLLLDTANDLLDSFVEHFEKACRSEDVPAKGVRKKRFLGYA